MYCQVIEWKLEKLTTASSKNQESYAQLISLCEKIRNFPIAMLIFTCMEAQGVKPTTKAFNALISTSLSAGILLTAISLFEIMNSCEYCKPDSDTYNTLISAYAKMGNKNATEDWVEAKRASGFCVDDVETYGYLIHCCIRSKNFGDGQRYFDEMILAGLEPNESIFHDMVLMYCQEKKCHEVKDMFKFLQTGRWQIDRNMASKVVNLYCEFGLLEELEELLMTLSGSNQTSEVLSVVHCCIIRMFASKDRIDDVEYSVERMLKHGVSFSCMEDVEKVICSYFRMEAYDRLDFFLELIKDSYKLTRSIYDLLSAGYQQAGLLEKSDKVANEMKMAGIA